MLAENIHPSANDPDKGKENEYVQKIMALTLIFAMLVPFTAAAAADEPSESRSMYTSTWAPQMGRFFLKQRTSRCVYITES